MNEPTPPEISALWIDGVGVPRALPPIVGRSDELTELRSAVSAGTRVVTFTGPAGIGKTRLAIEFAAGFAAQGRRVAFLRLAHMQDAELFSSMIATVGAFDGWPDLPLERLSQHFDAVLVLDGLDYVKDAHTVIERLRRQCPDVLVIVTCRRPLEIEDGQVCSMGPLTHSGESGALGGIDLYLRRADLPAAHRDEGRRICELVGGNPMAIELMAARARPGEGAGGVLPFDAAVSLADVVRWSIGFLTPAQHVLLRRLAVLPSGFAIDGVRHAMGMQPPIAADPENALGALRSVDLVTVSETARGVIYRIPAPVREVVLAHLRDSGELPAVRLDWARFYLLSATEMRKILLGRDRDTALVWFEDELPALRMSFNTFVELERHYLARQLAIALWPYWVLRERLHEGSRWLDFVIAQSASSDSEALDRELLYASGLIAFLLGNRSVARARSTRAVEPGDPQSQLMWQRVALATLAMLQMTNGDPERAIGLYEVYLHASRKRLKPAIRFPRLDTMIRIALSTAHFHLHQLEDAQVHADFAYAEAARQSDPLMQSYARLNRGAIALARSDWQEAQSAYEESIRLLPVRPQAGALAAGLHGIARILIEFAAFEPANRLLQPARAIASVGAPLPPYLIVASDASITPFPSTADPEATFPNRSPTGGAGFELPDKPLQEVSARELETLVVEAIATLNAATSHAVSTPVQEPTLKKGVGALTRREIEVLCLVAEDKTDRAIADILFISTRTVSDHMSRIIRKLGVYSRTGAVVRALIEQWCQ